MSDNDNGTVGLMEQGASSAVKQAGSNFAVLAVNKVEQLGKRVLGRLWVDLGPAFSRYLDNAYERYNCVKTLATGNQPRTIIGEDSIYVSIGARYKGTKVDTETVKPLLGISKHLVIEGTGGIGKSMLLRYLFLKTAMDGDYIPVLLTLRKINDHATGKASKIDLFQLIDTCMAEFDGQLPREQFVYSLQEGKYLFLLDGLDEVKEKLTGPTVEAIQTFCQQYPDNPCIITSRPRQNLMPLETFTVVRSGVLQKEQAIELASKLDPENEKAEEFCRQLQQNLFKKHKDFAENPLLLSMMFLTFVCNNSIADHLADFYNDTFDALYKSKHTMLFRREFHCRGLDEPSFKNLLSYFCFQSYFHEDFEFSKDSILAYIDNGIQKLKLSQVYAQDFIDDLCDAVCILVDEGKIYRFSHRSFQTYFAACYTKGLSDETQKKIFSARCFINTDIFIKRSDYCHLLTQMEPQRFAANALEHDLRYLQKQADKSPAPDVYFLRRIYNYIIANNDFQFVKFPKFSTVRMIEIRLLSVCCGDMLTQDCFDKYYVHNMIRSAFSKATAFHHKINKISFKRIDSSRFLTSKERNNLYLELAKAAGIPEIRAAIREWLQKLDKQRANLQQNDSDDFLESL